MSGPSPESVTTYTAPGPEVTVLFALRPGDDWPPYLNEPLRARLVTPFVVEIIGIPRYAYGVSRADRVAVSHDASNFIGRHVRYCGGHATVRVVAGTDEELDPIRQALECVGATVQHARERSMLVVDVDVDVDLDAVREICDAAVSITCNYEISSNRLGQNGLDR